MHTGLGDTRYWQLFKSVQPLFALDIPWIDDNAKVGIRSYGLQIKAGMSEAAMYLDIEQTDSTGTPLSVALQLVLTGIQILVKDEILEKLHNSECCPLREDNITTDRWPKYQKVAFLGHHLYGTIAKSNSSVIKYVEFLHLDQPHTMENIAIGLHCMNNELLSVSSTEDPARTANYSDLTSEHSEPTAWLHTRSNEPFWDSSERLFGALVEKLRACKSRPHSVMLKLSGPDCRASLENFDFSIAMSLCSPLHDEWQDVSCSVLPSRSLFNRTDDEASRKSLCAALEIAHNYRYLLDVHVSQEECWHQFSQKDPLHPNALPSLTMSQLIETGILRQINVLVARDRAEIALNLARSLLLLYRPQGGSWLQNMWTSENIFFQREIVDGCGYLRNAYHPCIACKIVESPPPLPTFGPLDQHALIFTFGSLLLELGIGEFLPIGKLTDGRESPRLTLEDNYKRYVKAGIFHTEYLEAIRGCLKFRQYLKEEESQTDEAGRIRITILKKIIQPLEMEITRLSGDPTLGEVGSVNLGRQSGPLAKGSKYTMGSPAVSCKSILPATAISNNHMVREEEKSGAKSSPRDQLKTDLPTRRMHDSIHFEDQACLFGRFDTHDGDRRRQNRSKTKVWGTTFMNLSYTYSQYFSYSPRDSPVKIAILDTGIDLCHPDFKEPRSTLEFIQGSHTITVACGQNKQIDRVKMSKNFCDDQEVENVNDHDGHGTSVAGIILQLAPSADLYIARVARGDEHYGKMGADPEVEVDCERINQSEKYKNVSLMSIEKAIDWVIEQDVDIVNMSFGYDEGTPKLEEIFRKVQDKGVIVFAAAANYGNHKQVAWPARDPEIAICVHSSNEDGTRPSKFTPWPHERIENHMMIGEDVCSHWPVAKGGGFRIMSGTSMATPVAASMAALLIAFTRQKVVNSSKKERTERMVGSVNLRNRGKMRRLMNHISLKYNKYHWIQPKLLWSKLPIDLERDDIEAANGYGWEVIADALRL